MNLTFRHWHWWNKLCNKYLYETLQKQNRNISGVCWEAATQLKIKKQENRFSSTYVSKPKLKNCTLTCSNSGPKTLSVRLRQLNIWMVHQSSWKITNKFGFNNYHFNLYLRAEAVLNSHDGHKLTNSTNGLQFLCFNGVLLLLLFISIFFIFVLFPANLGGLVQYKKLRSYF